MMNEIRKLRDDKNVLEGQVSLLRAQLQQYQQMQPTQSSDNQMVLKGSERGEVPVMHDMNMNQNNQL